MSCAAALAPWDNNRVHRPPLPSGGCVDQCGLPLRAWFVDVGAVRDQQSDYILGICDYLHLKGLSSSILAGLYRVRDRGENDILNWVPDFPGEVANALKVWSETGGAEREGASAKRRRRRLSYESTCRIGTGFSSHVLEVLGEHHCYEFRGWRTRVRRRRTCT